MFSDIFLHTAFAKSYSILRIFQKLVVQSEILQNTLHVIWVFSCFDKFRLQGSVSGLKLLGNGAGVQASQM